MKRSAWFYVAGVVLSGSFVAAGALKLHDPASFAGSVATFAVLPKSWSNAVAIVLPPFEILCGGLLWLPWWRRAAALGLAGLNLLFIALLAQGMARGLNFDCGCFGKWDPVAHHPGWAIARDGVLLAIAVRWCAGGRGSGGD